MVVVRTRRWHHWMFRPVISWPHLPRWCWLVSRSYWKGYWSLANNLERVDDSRVEPCRKMSTYSHISLRTLDRMEDNVLYDLRKS